MAGRSVRNIVHTSAGGTSARITLSNLFGQQPLTITHATIAVAETANSAAAKADTMTRLTFGGSTSVTIPSGQQVMSDAVPVTIPHDSDVLVTTFSPTPSGPVTYHPHARQTSYLAEGDLADDVSGTAYTEETPYWRYVTAVDVLSEESAGTVVAFGDSLTDGDDSTVGANHRWPDRLSDRLRDAAGTDGVPSTASSTRASAETGSWPRGPAGPPTTRAPCPASAATPSAMRTSRPSSSTSVSTTSCATRTRSTPPRSPTACARWSSRRTPTGCVLSGRR